MERTYKSDRELADLSLPRIKEIVGPRTLEPSSLHVDQHEAVDLTLVAQNLRIGCRVRRPELDPRFIGDFTLRLKRASGAQTEFAKVIDDGKCGWLFYGWLDRTLLDFSHWWIICMDALRYHYAHNYDLLRPVIRANKDGITWFIAFTLSRFPPSPAILIDQMGKAPY